jgi:hypothetical protein
MSSVFLCYRREDSGGFAGRIQDQLVRDLGADVLFMDVDNIPFGLNFVKVLRDEVAKCDVLLAVIGQNWLDSRDERGGRRLDNPNDFVRIEIETALKRDIPVVPILLDGVRVPKADDLPEELGELSLRNGIDVRLASFHSDVSRLIQGLKKQLNIDIKRRREKGLLALVGAIAGLLNLPFFTLFIVWLGNPIASTLSYLTLSTVLCIGCGAAAGVRSLHHGALAAAAGTSTLVFFAEAALNFSILRLPTTILVTTMLSALGAVWFGGSFLGTLWLYRKLRKAGLPPVSRTPRLGVMMELEVCHGSQAIYAGVQG